MTKLTRRLFLEGSAAATVASPLLSSCGGDDSGDSGASARLFPHGVASGDPFADSVILWTRVTVPEARAEVRFEVAVDPDFGAVVARGSESTDESRDFTVKVEATGLDAGTTYYYRFFVGETASPVGRTRTLPTGSVDRLRLAFTSCSNYPAGRFHSYRGIAQREDLDAVLHLGDYTYEYPNAEYGDGTEINRVSSPDRETVALADYRGRLAQYRTDPDLQAAHRQHPWIVVWDDHETANNAWRGGAENHDPEAEGDWQVRVAAALQAYYEWLPVREPASGDRKEIFRAFQFGDLLELMMLETRLMGREEQATDDEVAEAAGRQLLGAQQEAWLLERLSGSTATWKALGQQTVFTHFNVGGFQSLFFDQWEGYVDARARLLTAIADNDVSDVLVFTGDVHASFASEVPLDPSAAAPESVAVELVTPSTSAQAFGVAVGAMLNVDRAQVEDLLQNVLFDNNPHVKWADLYEHGYVLVDITAARMQAEWYFVDDILGPTFGERFAKAWTSAAGTSLLEESTTPTEARPGPLLAP